MLAQVQTNASPRPVERPIRWASPTPADLSRWVRTQLDNDVFNLRFTRHAAEDRLEQRGFHKSDVIAILRHGHPYRAERGSNPGEFKVNFAKSLGSRDAAVAVLINPQTSKITVLTVMWADKTFLKP